MNTQDKPRVIVRLESQYGRDRIFPVNPNAQVLANIAGTKTLEPRVLRDAIALGFAIQVDGEDAAQRVAQLIRPFVKESA